MNMTTYVSGGNVYVNCECVHGYAFDNAALRAKSAVLPVICANFGILQDKSAHFYRIGCLLPHIASA